MNQETSKAQEQLSQLFGSYKAEWLKERMFDFFTEPSYFPELTTNRPCILIGGRGTGKTTVLRCLSYEGQYILQDRESRLIPSWSYYGIYCRINTNRVTAFRGPELTEDRWTRVFAHYLNLMMCDKIMAFLAWHHLHCPDLPQLDASACGRVAVGLHAGDVKSAPDLAKSISRALAAFEAHVNNVGDGESVPLSMQGAPIDTLMEEVQSLSHFSDKNFFFLIDEYENFEDYQQRVVNTLIKHSGTLYTFKVGVRELGFRQRTTLNENEQLISPADYVRVPIVDKLQEKFVDFALDVCSSRIAKARSATGDVLGVKALFPGLSEDEEAAILDSRGGGTLSLAAKTLADEVPPESALVLRDLTALEKYMIVFWANSQDISVSEMWQDFVEHRQEWRTRLSNYKHALLYTLHRRKVGIRKYYCGWDVFAQLAAGNIRYFLELVDQSLVRHLQSGCSLCEPVSHDMQTIVAQDVGKKNLSELEGLSVHGAQLTKLLLGLGRILQTMAAETMGHAPEVNQFHLRNDMLSEDKARASDVEDLLKAAVMHLALVRTPGNKLADEGDTQEYDYMVHPIFSAFFVFSYRKKRKMILDGQQLLGLVSAPKVTIREVLQMNNRTEDESLPEQMVLFEAYYEGNP